MASPTASGDAKRRVRREIAARVATMSALARREESRLVSLALGELLATRGFSSVLGYLSLPDEACIDGFLATAVAAGARVLLPRTSGGEGMGRMAWAAWRPCARLARDAHGILAPTGAAEIPGGPALLVVPGRAFDGRGNRLGRGGGFYDRLLENLPSGIEAVGVAFATQVVDEVPVGEGDQPVSSVLAGGAWVVPGRDMPERGTAAGKDEE